MTRHDVAPRAALYASLLSGGPLPPEATGTPEEIAQRTRDRISEQAAPDPKPPKPEEP